MNTELRWDFEQFTASLIQRLMAESFVTDVVGEVATCHPFVSRTPPTLESWTIEVRLNLVQMFSDTPLLLFDARRYPQFHRLADREAVLGLVIEYLTEVLDTVSPRESVIEWKDLFFRRDLTVVTNELHAGDGPYEWH